MPKVSSKPTDRRVKPTEPYPNFPLFPHATGRWAKKVRGKFHYFGPWDGPASALDLWLVQRLLARLQRTTIHQARWVDYAGAGERSN